MHFQKQRCVRWKSSMSTRARAANRVPPGLRLSPKFAPIRCSYSDTGQGLRCDALWLPAAMCTARVAALAEQLRQEDGDSRLAALEELGRLPVTVEVRGIVGGS